MSLAAFPEDAARDHGDPVLAEEPFREFDIGEAVSFTDGNA
jgi:hypothetical protein